MELEAKLQQYLLLAKSARGRAAVDLIAKATAEPSLFAFGELLDVPSIKDLQKGDHAAHYLLLQLFAYGTCKDFKEQAGQLPPLSEQQALKLKQLTVITMAETTKVIKYAQLQQQLDIATVRGLEDFIIKDCFYTCIIKGKLDQQASALQVHSAIGRDVRPDALPDLAAGLASWTGASEGLLRAIEARITYACTAVEAAKKHKEEVDLKQEDVRRGLKADMETRSLTEAMLVDDGDAGDDDHPARMGGMERVDRPATRPKSRRR